MLLARPGPFGSESENRTGTLQQVRMQSPKFEVAFKVLLIAAVLSVGGSPNCRRALAPSLS